MTLLINGVYKNHRFWICESYKTNKYTVWSKCKIL